MNNEYFIGARNVCIMARSINKIEKYNITNFIYHCVFISYKIVY